MRKNQKMLKLLVTFTIVLTYFNSFAQCFVEEHPFGKHMVYTNRQVSLYNNSKKYFEASVSIEKRIIHDEANEKKIVSYSFVFSVRGHVSHIIIPDIAEITTSTGAKIFLYIPKRTDLKMIGELAAVQCYGNYQESDSELTSLMKVEVSEIKLKNDEKAVTIKPTSDVFLKMLNCLKSKM